MLPALLRCCFSFGAVESQAPPEYGGASRFFVRRGGLRMTRWAIRPIRDHVIQARCGSKLRGDDRVSLQGRWSSSLDTRDTLINDLAKI
jgi:hypothetical protein